MVYWVYLIVFFLILYFRIVRKCIFFKNCINVEFCLEIGRKVLKDKIVMFERLKGDKFWLIRRVLVF